MRMKRFSFNSQLNKLKGIKSHVDTITKDEILKKETDDGEYAWTFKHVKDDDDGSEIEHECERILYLFNVHKHLLHFRFI